MTNSVGALAAERERLEREIAALSDLPDGAADVVRRAEEILSTHAEKLAALRRAKDAIDAQFGISAREAAERRAREDAEARAALEARLNGAATAYLDGMEQAEEALSAFVSHVNGAIAAHTELRRTASVMAVGMKVPTALSPIEMINRLGGRIGGALRRVKLPDRASTPQIGPLRLPEEIAPVRVAQPGEVPAVLSWRQREEAAIGGAVADLLERGGR